ncbi:MAG: TIGR00304 family membrane protein [Candidatus Methanomethylicaceae archaeon]
MSPDALSLIFVGTFLIIAGLMLLMLRKKGNVEGGALIMIGPFPIVLGSSTRIVKALIIIAVAIILAMFLTMVI